jgi:hypothetical protein
MLAAYGPSRTLMRHDNPILYLAGVINAQWLFVIFGIVMGYHQHHLRCNLEWVCRAWRTSPQRAPSPS